jgi:hypothetical protein
MEMTDPPDKRQEELMPVVAYAVKRRLAYKNPDYWDHATQLELSILSRDEKLAKEHLELALSLIRESWEPETTARNIRMIRDIRSSRDEDSDWIFRIEEELNNAAQD